jgi:hypothetical protein
MLSIKVVRVGVGLLWLCLAAGCGKTENEQGSPVGTLCFDYFQQCVYPIALDAQLAVDLDNNGSFESVRRCSDSGCHNSSGNSGGGLRLTPNLSPVPLTPSDQARLTQMYINFLSAKGRADLTDPRQSPLLKEPLFEVNHGGGRVFVSDQDNAARQLSYWINNRVPGGGDEFAPFCATLFAAGNTCQP